MPQCPQSLKVNEKMALPSLAYRGEATVPGLSVQSTDQFPPERKTCFQLTEVWENMWVS